MSEWISVDEQMPVAGRYVLATYKNALGMRRVVKGVYYERYQAESCSDSGFEQNEEFNEEDDTYYIKPGWYEGIDNWEEYSDITLDLDGGGVTHWQPLPSTKGLDDE